LLISISLNKILSINRYTGIQTRSAVGDAEHPLINQPNPPTIEQLNELFMQEGVQLSINASKRAIVEWGGNVNQITHMVSTTCTSTANPGYDHYVAQAIGVPNSAEKILLAGIACSGGLAAIRVAANLALGTSYRQKPARILVLACEICSIFVRSELHLIHRDQEVRIGACLFSDAAAACIISNGIGNDHACEHATSLSTYDILGWKHDTISETDTDLGFDVHPHGWKVILTPRVPSLTSTVIPAQFKGLIDSIPELKGTNSQNPTDFDWALHPGGSLILSNAQTALGLEEHHLRASYEVYVEHGNSSSATVISVLDRLRQPHHEMSGLQHVIACAFGPGINVEMMALKRCRKNVENIEVANEQF
jgi:fungal type III polyketide synthase